MLIIKLILGVNTIKKVNIHLTFKCIFICVNLDLFFLAVIFQFAPCTGKNEIVPGQSGFNKTKTKNRYNKCYFLKSKLKHRHQC